MAKYRKNVAAIIVGNDYPKRKRVFLAERSDVAGAWQFPQGGIDKGEKVKEALFRELKEEIGTDMIKIIAKYPKWVSYDFPPKVAKRMRPYKGQKQRYFLVKLKKGAKIDIDTKHREFSAYRFVKPKRVLQEVSSFKKPVYKKVVKYFMKKGYL